MSKHKKQHYVPSCYLKGWSDPSCPPDQTPYIWLFKKNEREGRRKSPDNIFHETDMYTIRDEDGGRNLTIEHSLSELEGLFANIRNHKFKRHRNLNPIEHFTICVFIAAIHARTKSQLRHMADQWRKPLAMMDKLNERMKTASEKDKKAMSSIAGPSDDSKSFTYEEIKAMVDEPVRNILLPMIQTVAPLIARLDFAVICTDTAPGFITSDRPCVWFDPKAYTRPPMYRAPALMYETTEITLPIAPTQCICLNRHGINGYRYMHATGVKEFNRRTRFSASEYYVVNRNYSDDAWFDPGVEPEDSWEKEQARKKNP
jgi:uncharacterized protein DUF4238